MKSNRDALWIRVMLCPISWLILGIPTGILFDWICFLLHRPSAGPPLELVGFVVGGVLWVLLARFLTDRAWLRECEAPIKIGLEERHGS